MTDRKSSCKAAVTLEDGTAYPCTLLDHIHREQPGHHETLTSRGSLHWLEPSTDAVRDFQRAQAPLRPDDGIIGEKIRREVIRALETYQRPDCAGAVDANVHGGDPARADYLANGVVADIAKAWLRENINTEVQDWLVAELSSLLAVHFVKGRSYERSLILPEHPSALVGALVGIRHEISARVGEVASEIAGMTGRVTGELGLLIETLARHKLVAPPPPDADQVHASKRADRKREPKRSPKPTTET